MNFIGAFLFSIFGFNDGGEIFSQCASLVNASEPPSGVRTCRQAYTIGHDEKAGKLRWVHYKLNPINAYTSEQIYPLGRELSNALKPDSDAQFDLAPLVPRSLHAFDPEVFGEVMDPLIVTPMHKHLHRRMEFHGEWSKMTEWETFYAQSRSETEVYAGPIFNADESKPSHFFKIYYDKSVPAMLAMLFANDGELTDSRLAPNVVTVDCIEDLTGLNFHKGVLYEKDLENDRALTVRYWAMRDGKSHKKSCDQ